MKKMKGIVLYKAMRDSLIEPEEFSKGGTF